LITHVSASNIEVLSCRERCPGGKRLWYNRSGGEKMGLPFHQHLFPPVKKLVWEYDMLREGDRVAVGVSGGKDSLTALYTLAMLRSMIPVSYSLTAITVDMGWPGSDWTGLRALCGQLGVPLHVVSTQIAAVLFEQRRETNPCSLCSKMRHGAL